MEQVHRSIRVVGRVQGVMFRKHTMIEAQRLGLTGWVKNLPDGSVHIEAEGPAEKLDELVAWCRTGPPLAGVEDVHVSEGPLRGSTAFRIER
ncbi:MAG: acylphosphatase [Flavobacteriales bacterium]|nr:acylphosphatase [Flavobacteriales bacterium]